MRRFLPLLLCLSLSIVTVARAAKPAHVFAPEPDEALVNGGSTGEKEASDNDDSMEVGPGDLGEDMNNDDGDDAAGDEDAGTDDGSDDSGSDEGE
jgi:hypothetical protein